MSWLGTTEAAEHRGKSKRIQAARDGALRPPWSTEARIREACTSCGDCIRSCPQAILVAGPAGTPIVDFARGACTFCEACAEICSEAVFDPSAKPWSLAAHVTTSCLLNDGVACRSCTDACDERALRFQPRSGGVGRIVVDPVSCTGCGACLAVCPVSAIAVQERNQQVEAVS